MNLPQMNVSDDFLKGHFTAVWPGDPEQRFSDWRTPAVELKDLDSVMAHPMLAGFLLGSGSLEALGNRLRKKLAARAPKKGSDADVPTWPTEWDIDCLIDMYRPS